jgi:KUP system potassium uptake protein
MTRQAIQLGWLPRLNIKQTSEKGYGQIYVGVVNWLLMAVTIALTVLFQKSNNLAAAYGIAVSLTMLMTSCLLFIALREVWHWNLWLSLGLAGLFVAVDAGFFAANSLKIADGGYVPLLLAACVYGVMLIWHRGSAAVTRRLEQATTSVADFLAGLRERGVPRVPGTAVFLTRTVSGVPPVMIWHVKHNRALHERVIVLRVVTESKPRVTRQKFSLSRTTDIRSGQCTAHFGFMQRPDIPRLLEEARQRGCATGPREYLAPPALPCVAVLAGANIRGDGAKRIARDRLFPPAERASRRDRPTDFDLSGLDALPRGQRRSRMRSNNLIP